jgi:hypothetical protein
MIVSVAAVQYRGVRNTTLDMNVVIAAMAKHPDAAGVLECAFELSVYPYLDLVLIVLFMARATIAASRASAPGLTIFDTRRCSPACRSQRGACANRVARRK